MLRRCDWDNCNFAIIDIILCLIERIYKKYFTVKIEREKKL